MVKNILKCFLVLVFFNTSLYAGLFEGVNSGEILLEENGRPTPALRKLLMLEGLVAEDLPSLVQVTQEKWFNKTPKNRWELEATKPSLEYYALFKELGLIDALFPPQGRHYNYALVMGATIGGMQQRFQTLIALYEMGVTFDQVVVLTGERPLYEGVESDSLELLKGMGRDKELPGIQTEYEAARFIYENLTYPTGFPSENVVFINAPMKEVKGEMRRPDTGDTINKWMEMHPKPGRCVSISSQPYVGYQESVAATLLPLSFQVETVGKAQKEIESKAIYLDVLAKWLYQEQKRRSKIPSPKE